MLAFVTHELKSQSGFVIVLICLVAINTVAFQTTRGSGSEYIPSFVWKFENLCFGFDI